MRPGKGWLMVRSLVTLPVTILLLASASNTATAARVCIGGHFHYGGSGLHHDRVHAQASAVRAWRAIQAESHGARAAASPAPAFGASDRPRIWRFLRSLLHVLGVLWTAHPCGAARPAAVVIERVSAQLAVDCAHALRPGKKEIIDSHP